MPPPPFVVWTSAVGPFSGARFQSPLPRSWVHVFEQVVSKKLELAETMGLFSFKILLMPCSWRRDTKFDYLKPKKLEMCDHKNEGKKGGRQKKEKLGGHGCRD
jgi:hypothetical protein